MRDDIKFDFDFYEIILSTLKNNFLFCPFSKAIEIINHNNPKPYVLLRHDVDLDIEHALKFARIEAEAGVKSCYMIMTNSPFYNLHDDLSKSIIRELISLGHEIGLHFDFQNNSHRNNYTTIEKIEEDIERECKLLEEIIGAETQTISFHRPLRNFLNGPFLIRGKVNAYSAELMKWYLSDSKGNWREGNPLPALQNPIENILQLLIHPIWWDEKHLPASDRLQIFFERRTKDFNTEERNNFDNILSSYLTVQRSERI